MPQIKENQSFEWKKKMIPIEFASKKLSFDLSPHFLKQGVKYKTPEISVILIITSAILF